MSHQMSSTSDRTSSREDWSTSELVDKLSITITRPPEDPRDDDHFAAEDEIIILGNVTKRAWVRRYYRPDVNGLCEIGVHNLVAELNELNMIGLSPRVSRIEIVEPDFMGGRRWSVVLSDCGLWSFSVS